MKRIWILAAYLVAALGCRQATVPATHDIIYLTNGEEKTGTLKRITADSVWLVSGKEKLVFARSEVASIDLPQPREGETWRKVEDIDDPVLRAAIEDAAQLPSSDAHYINLYREHSFILHDDGTFESRERIIRYVYAEAGAGQAANNTWTYLADRAHAKLDFARSISPEGVVTHINEAAINRVSLYPTPAEYSNVTQIQIAVPEARVGSILDFQFSTVQNLTDDLHPIYEEVVLSEYQPTLREIIRMEQPQGGPLAFYTSTSESPKKELKHGHEVFTWTVENLEPLRRERMTPPAEDYLPRFIIADKKDWHSIAAALRTRLEEASKPTECLTRLTDSLLQRIASPEEKARALYDFVATAIRPAGPSANLFSYAPTPAEVVLERRFANNLDRAALLYALMKEAGLEADLVIVRSRARGRLVPTFPTLGQLDHALVLFDDRIYLEPAPNVPFGTLLEQDAMGLALSSGKLKKTPLHGSTAEQTVAQVEAVLSADGTLELTKTVKITGAAAASWKGYLKRLSPAERRQEAEEQASYIHPNARLLSFEFRGIEPLDADPSYTLRLRVPEYAIRAGDYLIFYLPGVEHSARAVGASERLYPIDRTTRSSDVLNLTLRLPAGAKLIYYPEDISLASAQDSYSATFLQPRRGELEFHETTQVNDPWIPPEDYAEYKHLVEGMARLSQEPVVLKLR